MFFKIIPDGVSLEQLKVFEILVWWQALFSEMEFLYLVKFAGLGLGKENKMTDF